MGHGGGIRNKKERRGPAGGRGPRAEGAPGVLQLTANGIGIGMASGFVLGLWGGVCVCTLYSAEDPGGWSRRHAPPKAQRHLESPPRSP
jgi:hypothetical protein